ncbi:MAG: TonB-dependent receptor [Bryobacteraceae bacterium]|nr:TonB-dependent receptor [Bryobacteraceae bacterium]
MQVRLLVRVALLSLAIGCVALLPAQTSTASLDGTVTDSSGATVPNAEVTVTNAATGIASKTTTNSSGVYSFPQLPAGPYELKVSATGFRDYLQRGIRLELGGRMRSDVSLEIGAAQQVVEVRADASPLNYDNAEQRAGISPDTLGELPLAVAGGVRSSATFLTLLPGAVSPTGDVLDAHVNGSLRYAGEMILNGGSLVNPSGGQGLWGAFDYAQSPDMVSELRVLQSNYEPQYGSGAGAVVIMETKSGTNEFHGGLFEFHRNNAFNARQYGRDSVPKDLQNDFGGSIGGPMKLPGAWSNRNKTYFFFNYEGFRQRGSTTRDFMSIPSLKQRAGDFSDWTDSAGNLIPIYDPQSTRIVNGQLVRTPFAGNRIDPSRFSPIARDWLRYLPQPTNSGVINNYLPSGVGSLWKAKLNILNARLDEYIGDKDHITLTLWFQDWPTFTESRLPDQISNDGDVYKHTQAHRVNWDRTFTPTLLNHFSIGYNHDYYEAGPHNRRYVDELPAIPGAPLRDQPPGFQFGSGFTELGAGWGFQRWPAPAVVGQNLLTWVKGKHTLKVGVEYRNQRNSFTTGLSGAGSAYFDAANTGVPDQNSGSPIASFLLGQVNSGSLSNVPFDLISARWSSYIAHVGDTWKVTPKLSLNLGLRWDMHTPTREQHDVFSFFDPAGPNPGAGGRPGRLVFAGNRWGGTASFGKAYPENLFKTGFAPRIGIAYAVAPKMVVRTGYGIFYDAGNYPGWTGGIGNDGFNLNSYSFAGGQSGYEAAFLLDQGFPGTWRQFQLPVLDPSFLNGQGGPRYRPADGNRLPYSQQWNLSVERQLSANFSVSAAYVGNKGTRLISRVAPLNALDPALLSRYGARLRDDFQPGQTSLHGVNIPYAGWVEQMTGCSPSLAQALLPYPQYCGSLQGVNENAGNSTFHSLQLKAEKRFGDGFWVLLSFTGSKMLTDTESTQPGGTGISPFERRRNKALSSGDVPKVFAGSFVYNLPFGRGRKFLGGGRLADLAAGGWQISGVTRLASGTPFRITSSQCNVPGQFRAGCLPAQLAGSNPWAADRGDFDPGAGPLLNAGAFEPVSSFQYYLGAGPRMTNLRGFGFANQDLSIQKSFGITERVEFQLRGDAFNVFNLHALRGFNTNLASPQFGWWDGGVTAPRSIQIGGRLRF